MEFFLASPTASLSLVAKKPSPVWPGGISTMLILFLVSAGTVFTLNRTGLAMLFSLTPGLQSGRRVGHNHNAGEHRGFLRASIFPLQRALLDDIYKANQKKRDKQ